MKMLIAILALLPMLAFGDANDLVMIQRNATDTGQLTRIVAKPAGSSDGVMGYNGTSQLPQFLTVGTGLQLSGAVLSAVPASAPTWASITGKPTFSAVATSGLYTDLSGLPVIPAAQVQSDWNAVSGLGVILNKPTIPTSKRIETYTGTTNASGQIVVTYSTAYPSIPNVQPGPPALANQTWTVVSSTVSGFTLQLNQRNTVTLLSIEVLLGATVPVIGAAAQVLVVAQ